MRVRYQGGYVSSLVFTLSVQLCDPAVESINVGDK
jgi:hypothetical protein